MDTHQLSQWLTKFGFLTYILLACTTYAAAQNKMAHRITYKGNVLECQLIPSDTIFIENAETAEREIKITLPDTIPITMNGQHIAQESEVQNNALPERSIDEYLIDLVNSHKPLFDQLADGAYSIRLRHFVVNEKGSLCYYKFDGIEAHHQANKTTNEEHKTVADINKLINDLMQSGKIKFEAAEKEGKKLLSVGNYGFVDISVQAHNASIML
jgi:hypothetical protein